MELENTLIDFFFAVWYRGIISFFYFIFADFLETKSVTESSSSETSDLKYGEDPGLIYLSRMVCKELET